jgi:hypothetical protein
MRRIPKSQVWREIGSLKRYYHTPLDEDLTGVVKLPEAETGCAFMQPPELLNHSCQWLLQALKPCPI